MKGIYLEKKDNNLKFFIGCLDAEKIVEIDGITTISESAFANSNVENILFSGCSTSIGKSAFENPDKQKTVIFGELGRDEVFKDHYGHETSILKNVVVAPVTGDFTIHANAFEGCSKLTTLILPKLLADVPKPRKPELIIKDNAFMGCKSLRTVVATCDYATFSDDPFFGCPKYLTFVCKKGSDVEKFANRNGYDIVHVD